MSLQKKVKTNFFAFTKPKPDQLNDAVEKSEFKQVANILPLLLEMPEETASAVLLKAFQQALQKDSNPVQHKILLRIFAFACRYYPQQLLDCQEDWNKTLLPTSDQTYALVYKEKNANPCAYLFKGIYEYLQAIKYRESTLKSSPYLPLLTLLTTQGWAGVMEQHKLQEKRLEKAPKGITGWTLATELLNKHYLCARRAYIYNAVLEYLPAELASIIICTDDTAAKPTKRMTTEPGLTQGYYI